MNSPRLRSLLPAVLCAAAGIVLFQGFGNATRGYIDTRSLFYWWGYQWFDPASESQHGPLVVLLAVWLAWRNLRTEPVRDYQSALGWALAAMISGACIHVIGYAIQQTRISILGFLVYAWGVCALGGGRRWGRAAAFPIVFLLFAVPFGFLDDLGFYLRLGVSKGAEGIAHVAGVEIVRSGTQLFAPNGRFQYDVAAACSGIRSLVALVGLGLVVGYLTFRSFWLRAGFALLALPFAFLGNLARILAIVCAGHLLGQSAGERVHAWSGVLVFLVVLGLLLLTARATERLLPSARNPDGPRKHQPPAEEAEKPMAGAGSRAGTLPGAFAVLVVVLAAIAGTRQFDRLRPAESAGVRLSENSVDPAPLPEFIGTEWIGQRTEVSDFERQLLPADTGYSRRNYVSVLDRSRQVFFSVVLSGRDRSSIHRPELCLAGQGWSISDRSTHAFALADGSRLPATLLRVQLEARDAAGRRVRAPGLFAYWFVGTESVEPSHAGMLLRNARDRLFHLRNERWAYVVVQTTADDGEPQALARMQEVVAAVWPQLATRPPDR
ncbi:hypothetical protein DB347_02320 [Opitutaceae bacterium EW11]|nr:hypothetical protein DB347_02320 [Opitutaceae bacterium EW11]